MFINFKLRRAVTRGDLDAVKRALTAGADPESCYLHGYTTLMKAAELGHVEILRVLAAAGADPNRKTVVSNPRTAGVTALMAASNGLNCTGSPEPVRVLIELGADPSSVDSLGRSALDYASLSEANEIASTLRALHEN